MLSKLFVALISVMILSAAGCRSNEGGQATPTPQGQSAQPTAAASVAVANSSPAATAAAANNNPNADACKLLTSEEIQAVQGEGFKATKGSDASTGRFAISQCFYETANFTNSVSLTLTKSNADAKSESPREFWKKNFGGEKGREKEERENAERKKEGGARVEEEEEGLPPMRVRGVGDEAFWAGNDKVGALYVLKGDKFIRISVGGADKQDKKIEKSKTLAQRALKRI